jgi:hypothetical protein
VPEQVAKLCRDLPPEKQEEVLDFVEFLVSRQVSTSWTVGKRQEDAFALALAEQLHIPLITTDHHEFDTVEHKGRFRFLWLR